MKLTQKKTKVVQIRLTQDEFDCLETMAMVAFNGNVSAMLRTLAYSASVPLRNTLREKGMTYEDAQTLIIDKLQHNAFSALQIDGID